MIYQFTDAVSHSKGNQHHELVSYPRASLIATHGMMATHAQLSGTAERLLYWGAGGWGGGANKQAPATLACRGFWGISRPEKFEILKLGNATFSILDEISKNK